MRFFTVNRLREMMPTSRPLSQEFDAKTSISALTIPALLIGFGASVLAFFLFGQLDGTHSFITGSLSLVDYPKVGDYAFLISLPITAAAAFWGLESLTRLVFLRLGQVAGQSLILAMKGVSVAVLCVAVTWPLNKNISLALIACIYIGLFLYTLAFLISAIRASESQEQKANLDWRVYIGELTRLQFAVLIGLFGILAILSKFHQAFTQTNLLGGRAPFVIVFGIILFSSVTVVINQRIKEINLRARNLRRVNGILTLPGVFLLLSLLPREWTLDSGETYTPAFRMTLWALIFLYALLHFWGLNGDVLPKKKLYSSVRDSGALRSLSYLAPLIFLKAQTPGIQFLNDDDFHFGEFVVPWQQLVDFGSMPYSDVEPARGVINYLPGIFSSIFYSGQIDGLAFGFMIMSALVLALSLPVLASFVGPGLAFLSLVLFPTANGLYELDLLVAIFCLAVARMLLDSRIYPALILFLAAGLIFFLISPAQAAIAILATFIPLMWAIVSNRRLLRAKKLIIIVGIFFVIAFIPGLSSMWQGALKYLLDQSQINTEAFGIPWAISFASAPMNMILYEGLRFSWILVPTVLLMFSKYLIRNKALRVRAIYLAMPIIAIALLYVPKAAGRIDPGSPSRAGALSLVFLLILVPVLLLYFANQQLRAKAISAAAILMFVISQLVPTGIIFGDTIGGLSDKLSSIRVDRQTKLEMSANSSLIPNLGNMKLGESQEKRLSEIHRVLMADAARETSFLDLTNHSSYYAYFSRKAPFSSPAMYTLVSNAQQERAVEKLRSNPADLILLNGNGIYHDGGKLPLRNPLIHKELIKQLQNYDIAKSENLTWLVRKTSKIEPYVRNHMRVLSGQEAEMAMDEAWKTEDLTTIPKIWGRSSENLIRKLTDASVLNADIQNIEMSDSAAIASPLQSVILSKVPSRPSDFLLLRLSCENAKLDQQLEISWSGESAKAIRAGKATFLFADHPLLVPLYSQADWLRLDKIDFVTIRSVGNGSCLDPKVSEAKFLDLN